MKTFVRWLVIVLVVVGAGVGGWFLGHRGAGSAEAAGEPASGDNAEHKVKPEVRVATLRRSSISQPLIAYGVVTSQSADVRVLSVPFESRVTRMLVSPGQEVAQDAPLAEVEPSPATRLALEEATNAVDAAQRTLDQTKQRFDEKLATNAELQTAENDLRTARGRLQNLEQGGVSRSGSRVITAPAPALVSKIDVQLGQVVPATGPLIELAAQQRIEVRLGVEPDDATYLRPGQEVKLRQARDSQQSVGAGQIRLISKRISTDTRLVDVFVSVPTDLHLLLDSFIVGEMVKQTSEGLIVPRSAVLPDEDANVLFTVADNHAVKHAVELGVETDAEVEVLAKDLKVGMPVVVEGNYELEDGMEVHATDAPPATEPTSAPATAPSTGPANDSASGGRLP